LGHSVRLSEMLRNSVAQGQAALALCIWSTLLLA